MFKTNELKDVNYLEVRRWLPLFNLKVLSPRTNQASLHGFEKQAALAPWRGALTLISTPTSACSACSAEKWMPRGFSSNY